MSQFNKIIRLNLGDSIIVPKNTTLSVTKISDNFVTKRLEPLKPLRYTIGYFTRK